MPTKNKGFQISYKPGVGQIWRIVKAFTNTTFSAGREFFISEVDGSHYTVKWTDGLASPADYGYMPIPSLEDHCEFVKWHTTLPDIDLSRYPHKCPRCASAAYVGATAAVDCTNTACPTRAKGS